MKKEKLHIEKVEVSPKIEWEHAKHGLLQLQGMLDQEIAALATNAEIRNAYSPIT